MFDCPKEYLINKSFDLRTFQNSDSTPKDRKRLKETLKSVTLVDQITGEKIASVLNAEYNVQIISTFEIRIADKSDIFFVADQLQKRMKMFAILKIGTPSEFVYSWALKRLNKKDTGEIVVTDSFISRSFPCLENLGSAEHYHEELAFTTIKNKNNKLFLYREHMVKAFLLERQSLPVDKKELFQSRIWYNTGKVMKLFFILKQLSAKEQLMQKSFQPKENVQIREEFINLSERARELIFQ